MMHTFLAATFFFVTMLTVLLGKGRMPISIVAMYTQAKMHTKWIGKYEMTTNNWE